MSVVQTSMMSYVQMRDSFGVLCTEIMQVLESHTGLTVNEFIRDHASNKMKKWQPRFTELEKEGCIVRLHFRECRVTHHMAHPYSIQRMPGDYS